MLDYSKIVAEYLRARGYEDAADDLDAASTSVGSLMERAMGVIQRAQALRAAVGLPPVDFPVEGGGHIFREEDQGTAYVTPDGDAVVMPSHYGHWDIEPIRFFVENFGPGILIFSVSKYLMRYTQKNGHEDLAKANRYLEMLRLYEAGYADWWEPYHGQELPTAKDAALASKGRTYAG